MSFENKKANDEEIAVFDVCDTLYYSNTTHDFVGFIATRKFSVSRKFFYRIINNRRSPLRYFLIALFKISGFDFHKTLNINLLRGKTRNELEQTAHEFIDNFLAERQIAATHSLIGDLKKDRVNVVLCSSSIEPVVKGIAENLGIEKYVSTKLEYKSEICTGKISEDITDEKVAALQKTDLASHFVCAVSDNRGDAALLRMAERKIAVVHTKKGFDFWNKQPVEIIDLRK